MDRNHPESLLAAAESVLAVLREFQTDALVIGAVALAAHRYVRFTEDIDLATNADADLNEIQALCDRYRLPGLPEILDEM